VRIFVPQYLSSSFRNTVTKPLNGMPCINKAISLPTRFSHGNPDIVCGLCRENRVQDSIHRTCSRGFLCRFFHFLDIQTWSGGGGIERCCACLYVTVLKPQIPALWKVRGEELEIGSCIDNTVAQNLPVDNSIHPTPLYRKDLQHLDRATR
jgi:hypothetical protein